jgi:hypothetical protein
MRVPREKFVPHLGISYQDDWHTKSKTSKNKVLLYPHSCFTAANEGVHFTSNRSMSAPFFSQAEKGAKILVLCRANREESRRPLYQWAQHR